MRKSSPRLAARFESVRPLVRYVDQEQAVVETPFRLADLLPPDSPTAPADPVGATPMPRERGRAALLLQVVGEDGFNDEQLFELPADPSAAPPRLTVVKPDRWWPAGLGDQPLYRMQLTLMVDGHVADLWRCSFGFTSIRAGQGADPAGGRNPRRSVLLINGREHAIHDVVTIDRVDERRLLPASGDSILLVRDHYGADLLYQAADRAGILMIQCVPIHAQGVPQADVIAQVQRLVHHPCLAGWFVGHLGALADDVARAIRQLDPTHAVFSGMGEKPHIWAA